MKLKHVVTLLVIVLISGTAVALGGNTAKRIRNLADTQTDMFIAALSATINTHFSGDPTGRTAFMDLLKSNLGLAPYTAQQKKVMEREQLRTLMIEHFSNGEAIWSTANGLLIARESEGVIIISREGKGEGE